MHIVIQIFIVRRWDNNARYLRQMGDFQTMLHELTDTKEQLRMASAAEREMREMLMRSGGDDPDERSKHGVRDNRI